MIEEKSVLIVDDEVGVRQALIRGIKRKFNKEGKCISISEAGNGKEAIDLARKFTPDLILMDIRMPIMDGLKACRILRSDSKFAGTMIIMLTCEITEESAGLLSGADDYVIKPFDIKTLLIRIERGLFREKVVNNLAYTDGNGILSKACFLATCLDFEIARAKRYQHSLSFLLVNIELTKQAEQIDGIDLEIAKLLQGRASDKVVRWSTNTFAVLLTETQADDAILLAKRISWLIKSNPNLLRAFVGIANLEDTVTDNLIANAESSLSESIRTGNIILNRLAVHH
ncbi:MAG: response regulator [Colwellia sp.]|nr:response regulator [Colwellia sp.]